MSLQNLFILINYHSLTINPLYVRTQIYTRHNVFSIVSHIPTERRLKSWLWLLTLETSIASRTNLHHVSKLARNARHAEYRSRGQATVSALISTLYAQLTCYYGEGNGVSCQWPSWTCIRPRLPGSFEFKDATVLQNCEVLSNCLSVSLSLLYISWCT